MKLIYIILINYNSQDKTIACLDSLKKIVKKNFQVKTIVVDNYPDNRIKVNEEKYKDINLEVIMNPVNVGFSGGMNVGIMKAIENNADYVLLLNNDTVVEKNFLQFMFNFAETKSEIGLVVPKIYFAKSYEFHKSRYSPSELGKVFWYAGGKMDWANVIGHHIGVDEVDHGQFDETRETDFATGCCVLIKTSVIKKIGLLDEKYFLYYEDSDFSVKAQKNNYKIYYLPDAVIWHKNAGSTGGSGSKLQDYYITRNRLYFGNKYAPLRARVALNREAVGILKNGREWQKLGVKDYYLKKMGKSTRF